MTPQKSALQKLGLGWLHFWFVDPPFATLSLMRIGTGLMVVYVLLIRSYDLEVHYSAESLGNAGIFGLIPQLALPFSLFGWFEGAFWLKSQISL